MLFKRMITLNCIMVKISYAICVCNEDREVKSLINFLLKVKDEEDEINVSFLIRKNGTTEVRKCFGILW
jgi:hypothetical protein